MNIPAPVRKVAGQAGATFLKAETPVAILVWQKHLAGGTFSLSAYKQTIVAGFVAAAAVAYHGLPQVVGAAKAARLQKKLEAVAAIEALVRQQIAAEATQAPEPAPVP